MRRDVFLENDSGGFSVTSVAAVDAVIDAGGGLEGLAAASEALLLELSGDDSMPVRLVVGEPLNADEEAQWLARASARLETTDGRLVVMGGFDPDVMTWWKEQTGGAGDGRGVALVQAPPGAVRVDVYAHVGSMNGRRVLSEAGTPPGTAFRRDHQGRAFPVWLAQMLDHSGEEDPGHESLWKDVRASLANDALTVDEPGQSVVGFLVHVTPLNGDAKQLPQASSDNWIDWDSGRREPTVFPLGLLAGVTDPGLEDWTRHAFNRDAPAETPRPVDTIAPLLDGWPGQPLARLDSSGDVSLPLTELHALYWLAGLSTDSPPPFEVRVSSAGKWIPPASTYELGVQTSASGTSLGIPADWGGWVAFWSARRAAEALAGMPDGAVVELAAARLPDDSDDEDEDDDEERNPDAGRMRFRGNVAGGQWHITEASPTVSQQALAEAVAFARRLATDRWLPVRGKKEKRALNAAAEIYAPSDGELVWEGDSVRHFDGGDERTLLLLAGPVFRTRFASTWAMNADDD